MCILKDWVKEILSIFVFIRFKNIWNLRNYLVTHHKQSGICATVYSYYMDKKGSFIGLTAELENTPCFPHGIMGIFISNHSHIGKDAVIMQQVTIGSILTRGSKKIGSPTIGDNCYIGAGAKIIGNIHIGNNCRIGANAVVYEDMPDNSVATCSPTIIKTKKEPLDNRFYIKNEDGSYSYYKDHHYYKMEDTF